MAPKNKLVSKEQENVILDKDLLIEQYKQCHESLRETDRKRDIIFGAYITLCLAVYALVGRLNSSLVVICKTNNSSVVIDPMTATNNSMMIIDPIILLIGLTILGILIGGLFTGYRAWHGIYMLSAMALQKLIHKKNAPNDNNFLKSINFKFDAWMSVEFLMFVILNLVILFNCYILIIEYPSFPWVYAIVTSIGLLLLVEFLLHICYMRHLDKLKNTGNPLEMGYLWEKGDLWILESTLKVKEAKKEEESLCSKIVKLLRSCV